MCGIVAYTGPRDAAPVLIEGLRKLEYRGYDSSGLAVVNDGSITVLRSVGKLRELERRCAANPVPGRLGIGHTRWATHGRPSEENAHPHREGSIAVVHNGIIENYLPLRSELASEGAVFKSETDTEILAHLINREIKRGLGLEEAVRAALKYVKGTYAMAAVSSAEPDKIVGARLECPLIVGLGEGETLFSSDIPAILDITRRAVFLDDGEVCTITSESVKITDLDGVEVRKTPKHIDWSPVMAEKGGYRHFMLKEIFEQPRAVTDTFRSQVLEEESDIFFADFPMDVKEMDKIYIVACGTSWHAALVGKFLIEELCRVPVEVDLGSEFRYRDPLVDERSLVVAVSQSGETADTLAALREAKRKGGRTMAICNVMESSITREALWSLMTHAGPEIGVASTKAFTTQLVALYMLAVFLGRRNGRVPDPAASLLIKELVELPKKMERALDGASHIEAVAKKYFHLRDFLYLGRGINYPVALEGALKLKEISYIHAEGYAAGEMKHGPIALIDEDVPVVVLAPADSTYGKILANMEEVLARGGQVIAVVSEGDRQAAQMTEDVITVPVTSHHLTPVLMSVPLQLLAYYVAVLKGTDVDQPRNLAKSVTVE
ncbi:MAG TPA: glutamine--fructose-6-phosphate transaminase (isomerizing) [Deltaproteobacteria bacterium]|nr:glutamine--fructose-6-phosphate transaminase (isomerizing) [Deltaproteobacteria bacterium]